MVNEMKPTDAPILDATQKPRSPRWMKTVLALSLTANLVVVAMVAGMAINGPRSGPDRMAAAGFGVYGRALDRDDRRALFRAWKQSGGDRRTAAAAMDAGFAEVVASLRATPFVAADLTAALGRQELVMQGQITLAHRLLAEHLSGLSDGERQEFADRLAHDMPKDHKAP